MIQDIWLNLPVKNVQKALDFYLAIGCKSNFSYPTTQTSACIMVGGKNIVVMLFEENVYKQICCNNINDTSTTSQMLISIGTEKKEDIDLMAEKVTQAGGSIFSPPQTVQGWMYGFGFCDLDNHRWNGLYMDISKMPK